MTAPSHNHPIANPESLIHTRIDHGHIELLSLLGVGAYGIVYLGRHVLTRRQYAVKVIANSRITEAEVRLHTCVSGHENILALEKVVREHGRVYLVLEYAPGGDLFAAITKESHGIVGNNRAIQYLFLQILDAVQHCHQNGVAHRDLKPENILLSKDWKVKLSDFGLATSQSVSDEFGCGSSFYFSPECQGGVIRDHQRIKGYSTQQNDIWSLGVILINLAAGRNPWKQATMQDPTFAAYVRQPRHFFRHVLPTISDELDRILSLIFCIDPARRISLPELRFRILRCRSFLRHKTPMTRSAPIDTPTTYTHHATANMEFTQTMQDYICSFVEESHPHKTRSLRNISVKPLPPMTPSLHSCSTASNSSMECPSTPKNMTFSHYQKPMEPITTSALFTSLMG